MQSANVTGLRPPPLHRWFPTSLVLVFAGWLPSTGLRAQPAQVLTNATDVRHLTQQEAARRLPVRLQGVVLDEANPGDVGLVMHDGTAGIYLEGPRNEVAKIRRWDMIAVEGVSDPGGFAPFVRMQKFRKLGTGTIPNPQPVTFEQLISGKLDAQWVEVAGIVRSCEPVANWRSQLVLATGGERLAVRINTALASGTYVDAEVTLRGICFNQHNANRQMVAPMIHVPPGEPIQVRASAPADPFAMELTPVANLLQFAPQGSYGHRVHVRGVVTHHQPGNLLWIREGNRGLRIHTRHTTTVKNGDEVDVLGFPNRGDYTPVLEDAIFRVRAAGPSPSPVAVKTTTEAINHDGDLIEVEAALLEIKPIAQGSNLVVEITFDWGGETLKAMLQPRHGQPAPAAWNAGSMLRVTGISSVTREESGPVSGILMPRSFRLLLRSADDLQLLAPPPRWTLERVVWIFAGVSLVSLLAAAAVLLVARRRLQEQAARRALAEAEFTAILKERSRVAREIHDTLAQGLTAISMQLELARNDLKANAGDLGLRLEEAHRLVRHALAEARNSIWNMRSHVLENGDLPAALQGILRQLTEGSKVESACEVTGRVRRLPAVAENNLLRIGQEALTNATKHAGARHIWLRLEFTDKHVCLSVRDDGCGFTPEGQPGEKRGFGLLGMRERATQMHAEFAVRSQPGRGTEILVTVPTTG